MSPKGRKRQAPDDYYWDCSVCTYKNKPEAFKCVMCDVRKGTSTRKSRVNPDSVAVQVQQALLPQPPPPQRSHGEPSSSSQLTILPVSEPKEKEPSPGPSTAKKPPKTEPKKPRKPRQNMRQSKLKEVDHSTATTMDITVDDVTIQITEYQLKKKEATVVDPSPLLNVPKTSKESKGDICHTDPLTLKKQEVTAALKNLNTDKGGGL